MCFIAVASHLHYVRPFWKLYPHNGGDLSALCLIFNPRWLKHPSAWLNVDRAIQLVREEVEEWGAHPARSDGSEAAGISSRSDEYLNGGLMYNVARDALQLPVPRRRPSVSPTDGCLAPQRCIKVAPGNLGGKGVTLCPQTTADARGTDRWYPRMIVTPWQQAPPPQCFQETLGKVDPPPSFCRKGYRVFVRGLIKRARLVFIPISDFLVMELRPNYFVVVGFIKVWFQPVSREFRRSQLWKMAAEAADWTTFPKKQKLRFSCDV